MDAFLLSFCFLAISVRVFSCFQRIQVNVFLVERTSVRLKSALHFTFPICWFSHYRSTPRNVESQNSHRTASSGSPPSFEESLPAMGKDPKVLFRFFVIIKCGR